MKLKQMLPQDFHLYRPYFENQRYSLCAYALSSIIAWTNDEHQPFGATVDGALIVGTEFKETKKNRHLILPISPEKEFSPEELVTIAKSAGYEQYWFVPEEYIERFGKETIEKYFKVLPHAAYDDYIYLVEDLAALKGNRYSKKRNLIKQFTRSHVNTGRTQIAPMDRGNADACLDFLDAWCRERDCDADDQMDLSCEKLAAIHTITNIDHFDVKGICLTIDGTVSAFGISAPLTRQMATLQYEKAFSNVKGLYQYFDNACARMLFEGYTYLNKESDMGMPGLAKAKRSYHPVEMGKSFRLVLGS